MADPSMVLSASDANDERLEIDATDEDGAERERKHWIDWFKDAIDIGFKLVLVLAAWLGWQEYEDRQYQTQVRYALQIVDDWEDQKYAADFAVFGSYTRPILDQAALSEDDRQSATRLASNRIADVIAGETDIEDVVAIASDSLPTLEQFLDSSDRLNYFFGKVGLCVRDHICLPSLMLEYFGASSCYYFDLMQTQIQVERFENEREGYGKFTEYLCFSL